MSGNMELIEDFLIGPADLRIADSSIDFNLFVNDHSSPKTLLTTKLKNFFAENSLISPTGDHRLFFMYFFLGSFLTTPYTGWMEFHNIQNMLIKVHVKDRVIKLIFPMTFGSDELTLCLRTVILSDEKPVEITKVKDYEFTNSDLIEIMHHYSIGHSALMKIKFNWKIFKAFQSSKPQESLDIFWAEILDHKIPIKMLKALQAVANFRSRNPDGVIQLALDRFQIIDQVSSSEMDVFLAPFKTLFLDDRMQIQESKLMSENLVKNYHHIVQTKYGSRFFGQQANPEAVAGFMVGSVVMNIQSRFKILPQCMTGDLFSLILMPKVEMAEVTFRVPVILQVVDDHSSPFALAQLDDQSLGDNFLPSMLTRSKKAVVTIVNFQSPNSLTTSRTMRINHLLLPRLTKYFQFFSDNLDKERFESFLEHELKNVYYQVETRDFLRISSYLLGQLCLPSENAVKYIYQFDEPHLQENIRSFILVVNGHYMSINLLNDHPEAQRFLNQPKRMYMTPQSLFTLSNMVHVDVTLSQGQVEIHIPDYPIEEATFYFGKAFQVQTINPVEFLNIQESYASRNIDSMLNDLESKRAFLKGILSKDYITLPDEYSIDKRSVSFLSIDEFNTVIPAMLKEQASNMDRHFSASDPQCISVKIISGERLPMPKFIYEVNFGPEETTVDLHKNFEEAYESDDEQMSPSQICLKNRIKRAGYYEPNLMQEFCPLTWEEINQLASEEKFRTMIKKYNNDPQKMKTMFEFLSQPQINLAKFVAGVFTEELIDFVRDKRVLQKLTTVAKISNAATLGIIYKNIAADLYRGDYKGAIVALSLVSGGRLIDRGLNLLENKNIIRSSWASSLFKSSRPFLRRFASGFNIYFLFDSISRYGKTKEKSALVGLVESSTFFVIDATEVSLELAGLEAILGIAGPVGAIVGAVVFVGAEAYLVHEKLKQVDKILHLNVGQKFLEGVFAFFTGGIEEIMQDYSSEKQINTRLMRNAETFLRNQTQYAKYIFPIYTYSKGIPQISDDNVILLDKRNRIIWPDTKPDGDVLCFTSERSERIVHKKDETFFQDFSQGLTIFWRILSKPFRSQPYGQLSFVCNNALGVKISGRAGGTLIDLNNGHDFVQASPIGRHTYRIGDGDKTITGSQDMDAFTFTGNSTYGHIHARSGENVADFTNYAQNLSEPLNFEMDDNMLKVGDGLFLWNITKINGRLDRPDQLVASCGIEYYDGMGTNSKIMDTVHVPSGLCFYNFNLIMRSHTVVYNRAYYGRFRYTFQDEQGSSFISIMSNAAENYFLLTKYDIDELQYIRFKNQTSIALSIGSMQVYLDGINEKCSIHFKNGFHMIISKSGLIQVYQISNSSTSEIIDRLSPLSIKLGINFNVRKFDTDESLFISGPYDLLKKTANQTNKISTIFHNDPFRISHLVACSTDNVFNIQYAEDSSSYPQVYLYLPMGNIHHATINLMMLNRNFSIDVESVDDDLVLKIKNKSVEITSLTVKNVIMKKLYAKITVALTIPMEIRYGQNVCRIKAPCLVPRKIILHPNDTPYLLLDKNHIVKNVVLNVADTVDEYLLIRNGNDVILLLYTSVNSSLVIFENFYDIVDPDQVDISIKFENDAFNMTWNNTRPQMLKTLEEIISEIEAKSEENFYKIVNHPFFQEKSIPEVLRLTDLVPH